MTDIKVGDKVKANIGVQTADVWDVVAVDNGVLTLALADGYDSAEVEIYTMKIPALGVELIK